MTAKFQLESIVYLKTDQSQLPRMVVQIAFSKSGVRYDLACGPSESWHYDYEISAEKDSLMAMGIESTQNYQ